MIKIAPYISILEEEIDFTAIRSQGAGGQNVNKVASAIHLRFDISKSSLPDYYKERLLNLRDKRITKDGIIVIKAQQHRTQEQNRKAAIDRLVAFLKGVAVVPKRRMKTKATKASQHRRLERKAHRSQIKSLRGKVTDVD